MLFSSSGIIESGIPEPTKLLYATMFVTPAVPLISFSILTRSEASRLSSTMMKCEVAILNSSFILLRAAIQPISSGNILSIE